MKMKDLTEKNTEEMKNQSRDRKSHSMVAKINYSQISRDPSIFR